MTAASLPTAMQPGSERVRGSAQERLAISSSPSFPQAS
jgi:hypothetical protein